MNLDKFAKVAESLRQYRRAELKDFEDEIGSKPLDQLYVDPLPNNAILQSVLSSNTTFLLGRKGTGKSTVFAKAQSMLRADKKIISIYIDVKSLYDVLDTTNCNTEELTQYNISQLTYRSHILRKTILGHIIAELLKEISLTANRLSLFKKWIGAEKQYKDLIENLETIATKVKNSKLEQHEIPVLQKITNQLRSKQQIENSNSLSRKRNMGVKINTTDAEVNGYVEQSNNDFDKTLDDNDIYNEYSDVVFKAFPFAEILQEIQVLLHKSGLNRLVIFFDDFSELNFLDQRLFVDVVLSPLNNSSNESIKLKVAGYPGRVYYGKIDPGKVDTLTLDFSDLYEATEVQEMEKSACDYANRLLDTRFKAFNLNLKDYFEINTSTTLEDYTALIFKASFNVPRIMGHLLHQSYLDKVSKSQKITLASLRLATKKYYENTILKYFDRLNRFALEPFEQKLDRHNQLQLLEYLIRETKTLRKSITDGQVGGKYFDNLSNPPTSHFIVTPELESVLASLESNFFLTRYKKTRDKAGKSVIVYAFFMGLTESERISWGYPEGRNYRNYFVQRCFEFTRAIYEYLSSSQTIKCAACGNCYPMDKQDSFELYKWKCPECQDGICSIVKLSDDFQEEVNQLNKEIMLDPIELDIVTTLNEEGREMRAGEIAALIDSTHQFIGHRTSKLQDMGLIHKFKDEADGKTRNILTERCERTYFE